MAIIVFQVESVAETSRPVITLATRAWSHLMPIARGSVKPGGFDLRLDLRDQTPDLLDETYPDAAETSFSRYVQARAEGDDRLVGLPAFVMRAFRHRCFLVRRDSDLEQLEDLRGRSVGATGWSDSGNTWTRSVLQRAGVGLDEAKWTLAPLSGGSLSSSRIDALPPNVVTGAAGESLLSALVRGDLDAIMAPFVPAGVQAADSPIRHLLSDYRSAEASYFREVGFVPGIHLVTLRREVVERYPWLPAQLLDSLEQSKLAWQAERRHYADTTPWMLQDLQRTDEMFSRDWMPYGVAANTEMVGAFCAELTAQNLSARPVDPDVVFDTYRALNHES